MSVKKPVFKRRGKRGLERMERGRIPCEELLLVGYRQRTVFELLWSVKAVHFDECADEKGRSLATIHVRCSVTRRSDMTKAEYQAK